jgi:hypothetical protein
MSTSDIKELYETHIKPLPPADQLKLVEIIAGSLAAPQSQPVKKSLLDLEGLGADSWQGVDAQKYVNDLRNEWK